MFLQLQLHQLGDNGPAGRRDGDPLATALLSLPLRALPPITIQLPALRPRRRLPLQAPPPITTLLQALRPQRGLPLRASPPTAILLPAIRPRREPRLRASPLMAIPLRVPRPRLLRLRLSTSVHRLLFVPLDQFSEEPG